MPCPTTTVTSLRHTPAHIAHAWACSTSHADHARYGQVSCSTLSTAAVTSDGRVFTWGDCDGGALGHGNRLCDVPTEVDLTVATAAAPAAASAQVLAAEVRRGPLPPARPPWRLVATRAATLQARCH